MGLLSPYLPEGIEAQRQLQREDAQTDLDLWFDYMYVYTCTQVGLIIIWPLSAFSLFLNLFRCNHGKKNKLIELITRRNQTPVSILKNRSEISKFNHVH